MESPTICHEKEADCVKSTERWNTWFTVNHVNNLNSVLVKETNGSIGGHQWIKLPRNKTKSERTQLPISRERAEFKKIVTMGQWNTTNALTGIEHSTTFQPKLKIANQTVQNMLVAS